MMENYKFGPIFTVHKCNIANKIVSHNVALQVSLSNNHTYSFVPNCLEGGSNKMHQGENYQDFLKYGGGLFLGHSLIIIK